MLFLFIFLHIFPGMNKFPFNENDFLSRLIKQENCSSPQCTFLSVYVLKKGCLRIHQRSVVKILITLLIKQQFHATYWLIINIFLRSVIGRKNLINISMEYDISKHNYQGSNTCTVTFILNSSFHCVIITFTIYIWIVTGLFNEFFSAIIWSNEMEFFFYPALTLAPMFAKFSNAFKLVHKNKKNSRANSINLLF